jgi:nitroreductase
VSETLPLGRTERLGMDVEEAIRTRRTHKVYGSDPVPRELLDELLELATWAPNHHLTNPWRFRVLGPRSLAALKDAAGPEAAAKLDRAPTLVCVSAVQAGEDPVADEEDLLAAGCATYALLLGAHARGLAAYWRTPAVLRTDEGRAALGLPPEERAIALVHLGPPRQEKAAPERAPAADVTTHLD